MIVPIAMAAAPLAILLSLSGGVTIYAAFAVMLVFACCVMLAGRLLLSALRAEEIPLAGAWVLGVFASALVGYPFVVWAGLLAAHVLAAWGLVVLVWAFAWRGRFARSASTSQDEWTGLALCALATLAWCWDVAEAPRVLGRTGLFSAWIDYFIHGGVISQFGDPRAGRASIYLVDAPLQSYHYASYLLPAALALPLDLPGLPLATSLWLPLGFFTMCAGAFTLGRVLAGAPGGIAALAALTILPDPSNYALKNGFFSFHWHLLAFPGATYAVGIFLLAIAFLHRWLTAGGTRPLVAAFALGLGAALFRIHLFALGFAGLLASAVVATRLARQRTFTVLAVAIATFALFVWAFYALTDSLPALELFLTSVHEFQEPTAYTGWYATLLANYGAGFAVPVGLVLVVIAALGIFIVLYPVSVLDARRFGGLGAIALAPVAFIACYGLLMVTAPTNKWDATELTVRPFVLLYAVVAAWTFAGFARWCSAGGERRARRALWSLALISGLGLAWISPQTGRLGLQPKFQWGWRFYPRQVQPGIVEAGAFLRAHSVAGDVLAVQDLPMRWVATDAAIQLVSLSGAPAYLAYGIAQISEPGARKQLALERHAALQAVTTAPNMGDAVQRLGGLVVQWYVVSGSRGPRWDAERSRADFVAGEIAVYAVRRR